MTINMKRIYSIINIAIVLGVLLLIACAEADPYGELLAKDCYLKVDQSSLSFNGIGSESIQVSAPNNLDWEVVEAPSWVTLSTRSSRGNANITISPSEDNPSTADRTENISLRSKRYNLTAKIQVKQAGTYIKADAESIDFPLSGGSESVNIDTNAKWEVSCPTWVDCNTKMGEAGKAVLTFSAKKNTKDQAKDGKIKISSANGATSITISVKQTEVQLRVSYSSLSFTPKEGESKITITANSGWTASSNATSWCTVEPSTGTGNGTLSIKVKANKDTKVRSATITVKSGDVTRTIEVKQSPELFLEVDKNNIEFSCTGGSVTVTVSSNISWNISSNRTWCTVSKSNGTGNESFTLNVETNTYTTERTATITISGSEITTKINVKQQPLPAVIKNLMDNMVYVVSGTFTMGGTSVNDKPSHKVTLSSDYYISKYEVTQEEWEAVMGNNPSSYKGSKRPVERVSWNDCQEFIRKLNAMTGKSFRLPTEAEWEYAARGGYKSKGYKYAGSNVINSVSWYVENSYNKGSNHPDYATHEVGKKSPNELGLYDMSGNVREWCQDWYGNYSSGNQKDPKGPSYGTKRVIRGGSWLSPDSFSLITYRDSSEPDSNGGSFGLRLVRNP